MFHELKTPDRFRDMRYDERSCKMEDMQGFVKGSIKRKQEITGR